MESPGQSCQDPPGGDQARGGGEGRGGEEGRGRRGEGQREVIWGGGCEKRRDGGGGGERGLGLGLCVLIGAEHAGGRDGSRQACQPQSCY